MFFVFSVSLPLSPESVQFSHTLPAAPVYLSGSETSNLQLKDKPHRYKNKQRCSFGAMNKTTLPPTSRSTQVLRHGCDLVAAQRCSVTRTWGTSGSDSCSFRFLSHDSFSSRSINEVFTASVSGFHNMADWPISYINLPPAHQVSFDESF